MRRARSKVFSALVIVAGVAAPSGAASGDTQAFLGSRRIENRSFYTGGFDWHYQAAGFGTLIMRGYDSTSQGGTIQQVTACFYNESFSSRLFRAYGVRGAAW